MRIYSDDIRKEFRIEKYAMPIMKSEKWPMMKGIELQNQEKIRTFRKKETYKYLEILEADTIKQEKEKEIY